MSLQEAQLFRVLGAFFGRERVVWNMSVRTVCGGEYPAIGGESESSVARWAEVAGCLFTIVDDEDDPKMVVEFAIDHTTRCLDLDLMERQRRLPELLGNRGIQYVMLTADEFSEILDPNSSLDLVAVLQDRLGLIEADDES